MSYQDAFSQIADGIPFCKAFADDKMEMDSAEGHEDYGEPIDIDEDDIDIDEDDIDIDDNDIDIEIPDILFGDPFHESGGEQTYIPNFDADVDTNV